MIVVVATQNRGKVREIVHALDDADVQWRTLRDYPPVPEPEETGATFLENATLKAEYYARHTGELTLAEDSGLEVDGLGGAPGVHSARYAGELSDDAENNAKVLRELADSEDTARRGRFVSTFVLAHPDGRRESTRGEVAGTIAHACTGTHGFGYDAIFIPDGYSDTFGLLDADIKHRISHRARALERLIPLLRAAACTVSP